MPYFIRLAEEEPRGKRHYNQEYNIHQSEKTDVLLRVSRPERTEMAESNQARQRRDQRTRAPDVYAEKEFLIVTGKSGKQNCRWYITDHLAGSDTYQKRRSSEKTSDEVLDCRDSGHISGKDEEQRKCRQKAVVHLGECFFIGENQYQRDDDQSDPVRDQAEYDKKRESKKQEIQRRPLLIQPLSGIILNDQRRSRKQEAGRRQHGDRQKKRREHDLHEFPCRDLEVRIKIQILRISKGCQHTAEVGGDILKDEDIGHLLLIFRYGKRKIPKRQERDQCHVIGDQHRSDKSDIYESQGQKPEISGRHNDPLRHDTEESDILQGTDHCERQEKTGQRAKVKVMEILTIRRHEKRRNYGKERSDTHYRVFLKKRHDRMGSFFPCGIHVLLLSHPKSCCRYSLRGKSQYLHAPALL